MVKFCNKCINRNNPSRHPGYFFWYDDSEYTCMFDQNKLIDCNITQEELDIIASISSDSSFIEAMDELKSKDIIEFNLKMSQFKSQVSQTQAQQKQEEQKIHCPKCNSTSIFTGARGINNFWGMLGASKTVNRCGNCGFTWKP